MTAATAPNTDGWDAATAWTALHRAETSPHDLAAIAAAYPAYAEQIARHPQAYPALVAWAGHVAAAGGSARPAAGRARAGIITDLPVGGRRPSGAHPLAVSADARAWREAVAAAEAASPPAATPGARAVDIAARVKWDPDLDTPARGIRAPGAAAHAPDEVAPRHPAVATETASVAAEAVPGAPSTPPPGVLTADVAPPASPATADAPAEPWWAAVGESEPPVNDKALLALVFGFVLAPIGIVFGHLARRELRRTDARGRGYAVAGLVVGYTLTAVAILAAAAVLITGLLLR
ncbi:DUF4190 domain-containing protein [Microbacterium sp. zg.Y1090]|uniref:DUF4190 domain-containing protein n=1 Tax=Microbacterium TaxID=33882 RepID=UPI00214B7A1B|nr:MULTISPECIES: DUF4190 domain-containing protein [unclassified Microbacterium]MCR2812640.1 DUF4190 domain-containing protein [Microbacterium sp. zg.Y1084]MCR2817565.1 DUF4190 domain-containing protein [Microbacterium sp. zg.Y1090]MDL5485793.1 DUF4190 domain-containing protein [Microbacterium sp. zg-Y1211]WIM28956.1 DUF4190 domain-containing protein [Microbacterium sp. zg-Y1090]